MKELLIKILDIFGLAFWIEVVTDTPSCVYYFGPFLSKKEAEAAKIGYIEDLHSEGAQITKVQVKRCKTNPKQLTIFEDKEDWLSLPPFSALTSQAY